MAASGKEIAASKTGSTTTSQTDIATPSDGEAQPELENIPALFSRLADDVMHLVDTKLTLLKLEIREEANTYFRSGMLMALGGIIAAIGFGLINVALAFGVAALFASGNLSQQASNALGFVVTGLLYLVIGGIVVITIKNRLAKHVPLPERTVDELRKDKQWLKKEL